MRTQPMSTVRGTPRLTRFDPIAHTPGTPDYMRRAEAPIRGQVRNSVVGLTRGDGTYQAGPVESRSEPWFVPSVPRRNYIPTVSRVELD